MKPTAPRCASLRYRRPYWMLFQKDIDNWKIYTVIHRPQHQRTEMLYQAWLGGLDRPYARPKCMAHQPLWLQKKRHHLKQARLEGPETPLEKYVLDWHQKFLSFRGTVRPTAEDLHTAFDLVERPLDLSYACELLSRCRNVNNIRFEDDTFLIFLEACLRVDRKDVAAYALEHADALGFNFITDDCRRFLTGEQSWYKLSPVDGLYYPLEENVELNGGKTSDSSNSAGVAVGGRGGAAGATERGDGESPAARAGAVAETEEERLAREERELEEEIARLEAMEREDNGPR